MQDNLALSKWVQNVEDSATVALNSRALALRRQGRDILNLAVGEPEFVTPQYICDAAHRAIDDGKTHYTPAAGIPELRSAVANLLETRTGREYRPEQVVITAGAKFAVYMGVAALLEPGDQVLVPTPYWVSYLPIIRMYGGEPVCVWAGPERAFKVSVDDLERAFTSKTRGLIFNSPNNPTGAMYSDDETLAIANWAAERNLWVISDEIYAELRFTNGPYRSIAGAEARLNGRTVLADGFSKAYAMTGWRVGWLAAAKPVADAALKIVGQTATCASSISQYAALAAITGPQDDLIRMTEEYRKRRDLSMAGLSKIDGIGITRPDGGFFLFLDVRAFIGRYAPHGKRIDSSRGLCEYLLDTQGLALVPGEGFGAPGFIRFSFSPGVPAIEKAIARMAEAFGELKE
jgi:aspartate aminotransferase